MSNGNGFAKNVIISGVDNSSLVHANNKEREILYLGNGQIDASGDTTITGEPEYFIIIIETKHEFCLNLQCNRSNSFLHVKM